MSDTDTPAAGKLHLSRDHALHLLREVAMPSSAVVCRWPWGWPSPTSCRDARR